MITNRQIAGLPCLVVPNVGQAYVDLCAAIRSRFDAKTIVISGSVGKASTKRVLKEILSTTFRVTASPDHCNARSDVLRMLQKLRDDHDVYLQEAHAALPNAAGQISRALSPDFCVITNIDPEDRVNYTSEAEYRHSILSAAEGLGEDGVLFVNGDDSSLMEGVAELKRKPRRIVTFGVHGNALDYRAENITFKDGALSMVIVGKGKRFPLMLDSVVEEKACNVAAAIAVAVEMGVSDESISNCFPLNEDYSDVIEHQGLRMLINFRDESLFPAESGIRALSHMELGPNGRRIVVLGDLSASPDRVEEVHRRIGKRIAESNVDYFLCYGKWASIAGKLAEQLGFDPEMIGCYMVRSELVKTLCALLKPGDSLLIRSGRRMGLNATVRRLFGFTEHSV